VPAGTPPDSGAAPLARAGLLGRCPRCGRGPLFSGLLTIRETCPACGLDLRQHDAGDGPAVAGIFLVGAIAVVAALMVDVRFRPPLWLHALLWPAIVLPLSVFVMRVAKATLCALQYRHRQGLTGS
jgi:uncharacterized protein (DUF983 family)